MTEVEIHPTAEIDPEAALGEAVSVGPFCVVGPNVEIGDGAVLRNHVSITGPAKIGIKNTFYPHCAIGGRSQDLKYSGEPTSLEIGNKNTFREFVTINRGTSTGMGTKIGNRGTFLAYSHVAHDCVVGNDVIFSNNGTLAGHVQMEDYAILGGLTAVHQFCRIGQHALTGGCSKIVQDVPPFMVADGNPAEIRSVNTVGLQRRDFTEDDIRSLKDAFKIIYLRKLTVEDAVSELKAIHSGSTDGHPVQILIKFIESSDRGIIR